MASLGQNWRALCLVILLGCTLTALAERPSPAEYPYPYHNPYLATTTVALLKDRDQRQPDDDTHYLHLDLIPSRNHIPLLEGKGKLRVRFQPQPGRAPLMFLIPGFGGSAYTGSTRYVAQMLVDRGFHVVSLPSPFHWNFTLAASRSGFPGLTQRDSEDLYAAMRATLDHLRRHYHTDIGPIGLIGLSHGALHAGFLGKLDAEQHAIGFTRILLINPPVNLKGALHTIDQLADLEHRLTPRQRDNIEAYAFGTGNQALHRDIDDPSYFADWDQRFQLGELPTRYLIGKALRVPVGDTLYVVELLNHPGILKTPVAWGDRSARLNEARRYDALDYLKLALLPRLVDKPLDFDHLSLTAIADTLKHNPRIYLMHNADDFLVTAEDLRFLEYTLGTRATIYPYGGHLGNLWFPRNRQDVLAVFAPLLDSAKKPPNTSLSTRLPSVNHSPP